jgi:integrase
MTFKVFARKEKTSKKGTPLIFIVQPGTYKIQSGFYCTPGSWDHRGQTVKATGPNKDPKATHLNAKLKRASLALQDILDKENDIHVIRTEYIKYLKSLKGIAPVVESSVPIYDRREYEKLTENGKEFYRLIDKITHDHKSDWSDGYKKRFRTVRTKFLEYEPEFRISMLNEEWWRGFVNYCLEEFDNVSNTINADAKVISALMKELKIEGADRIAWSYIEPEVLGLSWDKVCKLEKVNLEDHPDYTIKDSRTIWLAAAYTGRRWSELNGKDKHPGIGPENFQKKGSKWMYRNIGKGNKTIEIPLLPEAVEFFKRIKFKLPQLTNQTVNKDIKTICRVAGYKDPVLIIKPVDANNVIKEIKEEWETVHFHTARHSYGHHIADLSAGMPHDDKFISYMLGHASYRTSWKYKNRSLNSNEAMFDEILLRVVADQLTIPDESVSVIPE